MTLDDKDANYVDICDLDLQAKQVLTWQQNGELGTRNRLGVEKETIPKMLQFQTKLTSNHKE